MNKHGPALIEPSAMVGHRLFTCSGEFIGPVKVVATSEQYGYCYFTKYGAKAFDPEIRDEVITIGRRNHAPF